MAFLPFVCFLGLVWLTVCGEVGALPIAVGLGSFVVQTHFGYLPLVAGLLVVAAAVAVVQFRRRGPLLLAGVVGIVCWTPALLQQATGNPRNLSALGSFVRHPSEAVTGWTTAIGTMGTQLRADRTLDREQRDHRRRDGAHQLDRVGDRNDRRRRGRRLVGEEGQLEGRGAPRGDRSRRDRHRCWSPPLE